MGYAAPPAFVAGLSLPASGLTILGNDIVDLDARTRPSSAGVATSQTTTSTSYTDLATVGPAVTLLMGSAVLLIVTAEVDTTGAGVVPRMGFAISGASTLAATDTWGLKVDAGAACLIQASFAVLVTGLTPGTNIFTAKYRVSSGTGTFLNRGIVVWPGNNVS
jgi:hypothetical protein